MVHRQLTALVCTTAFVLYSSIAVADDDAHSVMLELSDVAADAVADEQFELGAVKFREAYDTYPDPILLNNEMVAWFHGGDCPNALRASYQFLETDDVESEDLDTVEKVQRSCHLELADDSLEEQNPFLATYHLERLAELDLDDHEQQRYESLRNTIDDDQHALEPDRGEISDFDRPHSNTLNWTQITGGVVIAGVGAVLHAVALDRQSQLQTLADSEDPGDADRFAHKQQQWGSFQRTTRWAVPAMYAVGAVSIGSGIVLMSRQRSATDLFSLRPSVSSERLGVSVSGRF